MAPASFNLRDLLQDDQPPSHPSPLSGNGASPDGHGGHNADEADSPGSTKRRRMTTSDFTRRKRTPVACQFCRVRKTKCDNVRPQCGYCVRQRAKCIYGDMDVEEPENEPSRTTVSNEQLMGRLNEIQDMLRRTNIAVESVSTPSTTAAEANLHPAASPWTRTNAPSHGNRRTPLAGLRCESILGWPCFAGVVPSTETGIDSFPLSAGYTETRGIQGASNQGGRGIREDDLVSLCRKFLAEVHPRNPVLDGHELMRTARRAAEEGLGWDSASCLVLLACALSSYTGPWVKPREQLRPLDEGEIQHMLASEDQDTAEAYYVAAQRRLGLLGNSIQDIQCFFFATIFEKFSLRPLRAWFHVQQACNRLESRLLQRGERPVTPFKVPESTNHHLEQRLYWSCFRAESELVFELGMNPSGLQDFFYPDAFPSPPHELFSPRQTGAGESLGSWEEQRQVDERGWCYYLSEISIRRTQDEMLNVLYRHGEEYWMQNLTYLIRQYHDTEQQVASWHYHLPAAVHFVDNIIPDKEFAAGLQGRATLWREYALRPIFYHVLHSQHPIPNEAHDLAALEIRLCAQLIRRCAYHRRHGGIWLICRKIFTAVCILLAAARHPHRVAPPPGWSDLTLLAIQILRRWGRDAQDLRRMADVLAHMHQKICAERGHDLAS
ncbi:hypothetical protein F5X68DRAFT_21292 [Plectosphaerella plurivora]|uniref:Zn(2)-C6 fungal-type domain-containing protein n=1 Tax=Plectosphaerella plurivora TaxID=936078 RepID=A0A9P9AA88_9PEZI|nr:hypothetical protein F5X68DRAFT_21292 [Plectosphaerella plurivora]